MISWQVINQSTIDDDDDDEQRLQVEVEHKL